MDAKELKEFLKRELPDVNLMITKNLPKNVRGTYYAKGNKKVIKIGKEFENDAQVVAHEIAHAIEHKRTGKTSHRNRFFWENMERKLGVDLIVKKMVGNRRISTVMAGEIVERERKKAGKYHLCCINNCGWDQFSNRSNKFNQNPDKCFCPRCSSPVILK